MIFSRKWRFVSPFSLTNVEKCVKIYNKEDLPQHNRNNVVFTGDFKEEFIMPFCENCGNKVSVTDRFCENCGFAIDYDYTKNSEMDSNPKSIQNLNLFSSSDWKKQLKNLNVKNSAIKFGIILTNTQGCSLDIKATLYEKIDEYIRFREQQEVYYYLLDLDSQQVRINNRKKEECSVEFVVEVLKEISHVILPDFVLIVGDRNVIPSIKWSNHLHNPNNSQSDSDTYVDSDLPYVTLTVNSPFERNSFEFYMPVGRIPSVASNGFVEAIKYFDNTVTFHRERLALNTMVLSAEEWFRTSAASFDIQDATIYPCPPYSFVPSKDVHLMDHSQGHDLMCFNLHGCQEGTGVAYGYPQYFDDFWLSGDFTIAHSPDSLPKDKARTYVISTEACYGAKPFIRNSEYQSVLMTALQNGCIGYLGSTQIAYGAIDRSNKAGTPSSADVICGDFSCRIYEGETLGDAYINALYSTVSVKNSYVTLHEIKTIASFALYGDPSLALVFSNNAKTVKEKRRKQIRIDFPDVRGEIELEIARVTKEIKDRLNIYIYENHPHFADITPCYSKFKGSKGYNATYVKTINNIPRILSVYLNGEGEVEKTYVSK